jgi:hypothetical protein
MDMKPKQRAKAIAEQLKKLERRNWSALIEAAIRDAESDIIGRLSEKFESQTEPPSPPSAAAIGCEMQGSPEQPMMARIATATAGETSRRLGKVTAD